VPARPSEDSLFLQILDHHFDDVVDGLLGGVWVEGVAEAGPDEISLGRTRGVEVGLDAHRLVFAQIVRRIDLTVCHGVVTVERVVVGIRDGLAVAGNVGNARVHLYQPRQQDSFDLVLANLRLQVVHVHVGRVGP
jgi:hypothetical protein